MCTHAPYTHTQTTRIAQLSKMQTHTSVKKGPYFFQECVSVFLKVICTCMFTCKYKKRQIYVRTKLDVSITLCRLEYIQPIVNRL